MTCSAGPCRLLLVVGRDPADDEVGPPESGRDGTPYSGEPRRIIRYSLCSPFFFASLFDADR
jgi:hypothetical protein